MSPENQRLHSIIEGLLPAKTPLRVLEAGCGSTSHLPLDERCQLTGIDISERQLARNARLHERIVGDLETHRWDAEPTTGSEEPV